jgi:hypothetical protein
MNEDLIMDIWDMFKEYVPEKNREGAATHYVDFLVGQDVDAETLQGLLGYDQHLDLAIESIVELDKDDEDEDEIDEWSPDEDY